MGQRKTWSAATGVGDVKAPEGSRLDKSETTGLVRAKDWAATELGPMAGWPPLLRSTVDVILASPMPMAVVWDVARQHMIYNQAYAEILGDRHPQAIGRTAREVWPELWGIWCSEVFAQVFEGKSIAALDQCLMIERSGRPEPLWFDLYYAPLGGAEVIEGVLCTAIDCTQRKAAESALQVSEEQFRTLAEAVPHHIWMADADGNFSWFNSRVYDFVGSPHGVELNGEWVPLVHPEDSEEMLDAWQVALTDQGAFEHTYRLLDPRGQYRWHLARALPTRDSEGEVVRWIGTNTDIHDQRGQADALLERNAALEKNVAVRTRERDRIWNVSRDLLLVADRNGHWLAVNPAWTLALGWNEEELLSTPSADFIHADDRQTILDEVGRLGRGESSGRFECRLQARDGSYRMLSWTSVLIDGLIYGVARDITAEREAARVLAETEAALHQAQKMEIVGQLTGGIAHDFNNLLQGITGSLDIVRRRLADGRAADAERFLQGAAESADRASALTHRLLAFARRQPLDPRATDANRLIDSMRSLLEQTLGERIRLDYRLDPDLWGTRCDPNQLESALLNLAINGRDAMPEGGTLTIVSGNVAEDGERRALPPDLAPGDYVRVSVVDTGGGMDTDVMARAFEPFFTTKPSGQGTGLGLSMIYGFARQSCGKAVIHSGTGLGTTVTLFLPRHDGEVADTPTEEAQPEAAVGKGETVLVVEDEPVVRALIVELLDELGYHSIAAEDGAPGLEILRSDQAVALLITDIGLPGMNGQELAEQARRLRPELPILFMTGYADAAARPEGFLSEGMALITKPFGGAMLASRIGAMLRRS
ncbi:PAS domain S-box protein [Sphingomonas sp. DBB INV C78]|uniref:PAS domain-containing hybrid sensor histidine kinase/response regulator n=1 Tax=Sphingomonas sp. DBB INV C78 TaxID=3349434 RepID=UPI0036D28D76